MNKGRVFIPVIMGDILSQANLGFENDRQAIINLVDGTMPDILVLDSLGGSHTKGENKVEDVRPVLEFLALLARDKKMAVVVVHHLNKGQEKESPEVSLYRLRGSTIIPAMCRSIIAIEKAFENNNKIRMIKNNLAKPPEPITVTVVLNDEEDIAGFDFKGYETPMGKKNKVDVCAEWLVGQLTKSKKGASPGTLYEWAEGEFTRQMIYSARRMLGDRISVTGTGNDVVWSLTLKDETAVKKILSSNNGHGKSKKGDKHGRSKTK
jgi:hypothetical protein